MTEHLYQVLSQPTFWVGFVFVILVQAAKFGQLNVADPINGRYLALLPGAVVRDFTGPVAYHLALGGFILVSVLAYFLFCLIPPTVVIEGALPFFGAPGVKLDGTATQKAKEYYPLFIAAALVGVTQPIPALGWIGNKQRDFFHDQIDVPRRVIDLSQRLIDAIESRSKSEKGLLAIEVRKLAGSEFSSELQSFGDEAYYRVQREKLGVGNDNAVNRVIEEASVLDLRELIERLVLSALVAVMRKSGTKSLDKISEKISGAAEPIGHPEIGYTLSGLVASGIVFAVSVLVIAHLLDLLRGPVESLLGRTAANTLWPPTIEVIALELWNIIPGMVVCLCVTVFLLVPRVFARARQRTPKNESWIINLVRFFHAHAGVLSMCIVISLLLKFSQLFYELAVQKRVSADAFSPSRLVFPLVQSFIPFTACLFTTWHLTSTGKNASHHGLPFMATAAIMCGAVGAIALLYDLTFLRLYLVGDQAQYRPGYEHIIFVVLVNVLVSFCAFGSLAVFFKARERLQAVVDRRRRSTAPRKRRNRVRTTVSRATTKVTERLKRRRGTGK